MAPPPPLSQHLPRTGGGGRNSAILASPAWRGSGQRRPIAFRFRSYFWVVFPYDLLPDRLRPVDLPLGQVSKWHAIGVTIGALTVHSPLSIDKEVNPLMAPLPPQAVPLPRSGRGGRNSAILASPAPAGEARGVRGVVVSPKQTLVEQVKISARSAPCEFRRSSEARFGIRRYLRKH